MLLLHETLARATSQPQYRIVSDYSTSLEISLERNRDEVGEGHREDVALSDGFTCCVNAFPGHRAVTSCL